MRRALDRAPDGRLLLGDVVGELAGLDAQTAVVETRDGLVEVPVGLVTAARLVPTSTAEELALSAVAAQGLRPAETAELGGWTLRADHGFTARANSVLPLRQPGMPLDAALAAAHAWYAERGLPLQIHVGYEGRRLLDAELGERGWHAEPAVHVMVTRLDTTRSASHPEVHLVPEPDDDWLALYRGGRARAPEARALLVRHDRVIFAALRRAGQTLAVGRGCVDEDWLGVMAMEVAPDYRRQGLATAVLNTLCEWGRAQGARRSYLQVFADNAAAVGLYTKLGYWVHHDYHYRREPETFLRT